MKKHLILLVVLFLVLIGGNFIVNPLFSNPLTLFDIVLSHVILVLLFGAGIFLIHFVNDFDKTKVGLTFLGLSVVKMLFALGFIVVQIQVNKKPNELAISFVTVYFIYLVYLSYVTFSILNLKADLKKE